MASSYPHHEADSEEMWKEVGQKSIMNPRGLHVTWGGTGKGFWKLPEPNQEDPLTLRGVCWLEVSGSKEIDPRKSYEIGFNVSLSHDWPAHTPLYVMAKLGEKGSYICRKVDLHGIGKRSKERFDIPHDKKFAIKFSKSSERMLYFGLYDTWNMDAWKAGLHIHHAFVAQLNTTTTLLNNIIIK